MFILNIKAFQEVFSLSFYRFRRISFLPFMHVTFSALHTFPNLLQCQKHYNLKHMITIRLLGMVPCAITAKFCSKVMKSLNLFHIKFKKCSNFILQFVCYLEVNVAVCFSPLTPNDL
jgi:hypothetical protein